MNIFTFELKKYWKSILIWSAAIIVMAFMFMAFYPVVSKDALLMDNMLANYPEHFLKAFGLSKSNSMSTVLGYMGFIYPFIQIAIGMQMAKFGFEILTKEENELTADFLFSKPVTRTKIFMSKYLAVFIVMIIMNTIITASIFGSVETYKNGSEYDQNILMLLMKTNVLFQLFFLNVGMCLSMLMKKIKSVVLYAVGLTFFMYIINAIRAIVDSEFLEKVTPFYYFDPNTIMGDSGLDVGLTILCIVIIVISFVISFILYNNRNIHSV